MASEPKRNFAQRVDAIAVPADRLAAVTAERDALRAELRDWQIRGAAAERESGIAVDDVTTLLEAIEAVQRAPAHHLVALYDTASKIRERKEA